MLECLAATRIGQRTVDVVGKRHVIWIRGAQATGDEVARLGAQAPLQALAGVDEGVRKDVGSVQPGIDRHVVDGARDPTRPGGLGGRRQCLLDANDGVDVAPLGQHLDERVELDPP